MAVKRSQRGSLPQKKLKDMSVSELINLAFEPITPKKKPEVGDKFTQNGQIWRISDITADIITLKSGNGRRPDRIIHPSELNEYIK